VVNEIWTHIGDTLANQIFVMYCCIVMDFSVSSWDYQYKDTL